MKKFFILLIIGFFCASLSFANWSKNLSFGFDIPLSHSKIYPIDVTVDSFSTKGRALNFDIQYRLINSNNLSFLFDIDIGKLNFQPISTDDGFHSDFTGVNSNALFGIGASLINSENGKLIFSGILGGQYAYLDRDLTDKLEEEIRFTNSLFGIDLYTVVNNDNFGIFAELTVAYTYGTCSMKTKANESTVNETGILHGILVMPKFGFCWNW